MKFCDQSKRPSRATHPLDIALFVPVNLLKASNLVFYSGQTFYSILLTPDDFTREG